MDPELTRRELFLQAGVYGGSAWLLFALPRPLALAAARESSSREVFTDAEWQTAEAVASRIIPSDDAPGAIEAGCVNFIDKALAHEDKASRPIYAEGLAAVDAMSRTRFGKTFAELDAAKQDELLVALQADSADGWTAKDLPPAQFFETIRMHTIVGFLADPKYGGNQNYVGWKLLGYPGPRHHRGGYTPDEMLGKRKIAAIWGEEL
jgi:gluconate 2-dehydrogenase gamma chain